jgi:hypothetical protein
MYKAIIYSDFQQQRKRQNKAKQTIQDKNLHHPVKWIPLNQL